MRKVFSLLIVSLVMTFSVYSQDFIVKKTGDEVKVKILELTPEFIKFKKFNNEDGPTHTIKKKDVFMVKYANGETEVLKEIESEPEIDKNKLAMQGKRDAQMNYKKKNTGAGWTSATTVLLSPIIGVIPAAVCSSSEPDLKNLKVPDLELMDEYEYNMSYTEEAHKMKKKKVWTSFGISSGAWFVLILLL